MLNVGAGAGSYEPSGREVTAVEPSASMRAQRPPGLAPAVDATAEDLPFADGSFDAAMTTFSVHQWSDLGAGLREVRRVTRGPVVVLTCDPDLLTRFWLTGYAPEVIDTEARRYPSTAALADGLAAATARSPWPRCRSRSTAPTASTRPTTAGPRPCSTRRPGGPARPGASWARKSTSASPGTCAATWPTGPGIAATVSSARQPTFDGSLILVTSAA